MSVSATLASVRPAFIARVVSRSWVRLAIWLAIGNEDDPQGWGMWIAGPIGEVMGLTTRDAPTMQGIAAIEFFKYFVYSDSAWSYVGYDLARAGRDGATVAAILSATNPDLSAFARGGKLLLAHGCPDPGRGEPFAPSR